MNKNYAALNESYKQLKIPLQQYTSIAKNGGWKLISPITKKLQAGDSAPSLVLIKKDCKSPAN